jgi:hypothetical protein
MADALQPPTVEATKAIDPVQDLPVVARLVVEIRSDGTRTIARGALEDQTTGQKVSVRADGTTPAALAASLARSLFDLPALQTGRQTLRRAVRALLPGRRSR